MRLLDVRQLTLEDFPSEKDVPPYAILSHTWGDGEVTFQDLTKPDVQSMQGYAKIQMCCEEAKTFGIDYVWIDTCCIDKTSSAELSEAINSMYKWYQFATICYAYLFDVEACDDPDELRSQLSNARWFTRGWTLQELIAPQVVVFYNRHWTEIGTKKFLSDVISLITDIPVGILMKTLENDNIGVAERMSWAAKRQTTRAEDAAYSLLGIFNVNMPTLYGEGDKAFIRLQQEIMKFSSDHSLFAWSFPQDQLTYNLSPDTSTNDQEHIKKLLDHLSRYESGLLSTSPLNFRHGRGIKGIHVDGKRRRPFSLTNSGLQIWLPLVQVPHLGDRIYQAILDCEVSYRNGNLIIYLEEDELTGQYSRILPEIVHISNDFIPPAPREIFVKNVWTATPLAKSFQGLGFPNIQLPPCFRFHLVRTASEKTMYNIVRSSVDSTAGFIDVSPHQEALEYLLIKAKADPTVQTLIALSWMPPYQVGNAEQDPEDRGELALLFNLSTAVDFNPASDIKNPTKRNYRNDILESGFDKTAVGQSETLQVIHLTNGWKVSVSFRRGGQISEEWWKRRLYHLSIAFIPPNPSDSLFADLSPILPVGSLPDCLPRLTVLIKPLELASSIMAWVPKPSSGCRIQVFVGKQILPEAYHGVLFWHPRSQWAKTSLQSDGYLYQWTPSHRHRTAVIALGPEQGVLSKLFQITLKTDLRFSFKLRDPVWDMSVPWFRSKPGPRIEDHPDFAPYRASHKRHSKNTLTNFSIEMKEWTIVREDGATMHMTFDGLLVDGISMIA